MFFVLFSYFRNVITSAVLSAGNCLVRAIVLPLALASPFPDVNYHESMALISVMAYKAVEHVKQAGAFDAANETTSGTTGNALNAEAAVNTREYLK